MRFGYNPSESNRHSGRIAEPISGTKRFFAHRHHGHQGLFVHGGFELDVSSNAANEFRFSFGKRATSFRSQNGEAVAFNISGAAFIGRELFSPVDRRGNAFSIRR